MGEHTKHSTITGGTEGTYHSGRCGIIYYKWNKKYHDG